MAENTGVNSNVMYVQLKVYIRVVISMEHLTYIIIKTLITNTDRSL